MYDKNSFSSFNRSEFDLNVAKIVVKTTILNVFSLFSLNIATPVSATSITLSVPTDALRLDLQPNNTFARSTSGTVSVQTDASGGYTLSVKAKNSENSNALLNGDKKINSITEQTSEDLFKSDSKFNNTWGYLPSKFNSLNNTDFLPGPTIEESILDSTEAANNGTGTDYSITIGAKVDSNMSAGEYSNSFIFSATTNDIPIVISGNMQEWDGCASLPDDGKTYVTLQDTRDDNIYNVAKLKDGNCWMVQNLRLGDSKLTEKNPERKLTAADSDLESDFILPESSKTGFDQIDSISLYVPEADEGDEKIEYGGYYSWRAANAGEIEKGSSSIEAENSICPKGWHLPSALSGDSFNHLLFLYGYDSETNEYNDASTTEILKKGPVPNFILPGYIDKGNFNSQGEAGYYWSSTHRSRSIYPTTSQNISYYQKFLLNIDNSANVTTSIATFNSKEPLYALLNTYPGYSIRCVANGHNTTDKIMQDVSEWKDTVREDQTISAIDERDNNTYTVARLKDGNVWMTKNMRLFTSSVIVTRIDVLGELYGHLYSSSNDASCPDGWHLPSREEYEKLSTYYSPMSIQQNPARFFKAGKSWCIHTTCTLAQLTDGDPKSSEGYYLTSDTCKYDSSGTVRFPCVFHINDDKIEIETASSPIGEVYYSARCLAN